ncbi:MAG: ABC transporter permease [Clostridiales Family XIII bacterium]|jgi:peptide/nickel transport system permease protein|nr:ABC transporter permease [Clostridiales Family XIII bacterium]
MNFLKTLFKKKPIGGAGLVILVFFVILAIASDWIAPYPMVNGVMQSDVINSLSPSTPEHLFGTDSLGRDVLSYMIYGARTSVILGITCTVLTTIVSVVIGVSSAVIGGKFDLILQRFVDGWTCIPGILLLLIIMGMLGNGILQLIFAISIPMGIAGSRMIRSAAISVKDSGYMKMSSILGAPSWWKMIKHVVPNIMPLILMGLAGSLGGIILMEASMNFLGYGVEPGTPSWGYLITDQGRSYMYQAPWLAVYPGIAISLMVFASAMFGDAVRDILDPRLKGGVGSYSSEKIEKQVARMLGGRALIK